MQTPRRAHHLSPTTARGPLREAHLRARAGTATQPGTRVTTLPGAQRAHYAPYRSGTLVATGYDGGMDISQIEEEARRKLEEEKHARIKAAVTAAEAAKDAADLAAQLREAEKLCAKTWDAAVKAGWTETELRKFGLSAPPKVNKGGRPPKTEAAPEPAPVHA